MGFIEAILNTLVYVFIFFSITSFLWWLIDRPPQSKLDHFKNKNKKGE